MNTPLPNRLRWAAAALVVVLLPVALHAATEQENWNRLCARCHGATGNGDTKAGKKLNVRDYTQPAVQAKFTDAEALTAITEGVKADGKEVMQGYSEKLPEKADREALVKFVRGLAPTAK